jgi:hypothetical protein
MMNKKVTGLLGEHAVRQLVRAVLASPYIEKNDLADRCGVPAPDLEITATKLVDEMILLELASQADSSMESRVPKKIYLVNPEMEEEIRAILA